MNTPWGRSQHQETIAEGIVSYSTASHGGIKLSPERQAKMPKPYLREDGWYEEDCDVAFVMVTFPECFDPKYLDGAVRSIKEYYPDEYTQVTGIPLEPSESYALRERQLYKESK